MARGRRSNYKKPIANAKRRRSRSRAAADDHDDDDDYAAEEEDEELESSNDSDVSPRDSSSEESFDFSEATSASEDDDDDGIEVAASKHRRASSAAPRRKPIKPIDAGERIISVPTNARRRCSRVSDLEEDEDDDDEDFSPEEDDDDDEEVESYVITGKNRKSISRNRHRKPKKRKPAKPTKKRKPAKPTKKRGPRAASRSEEEEEDDDDDDDFTEKVPVISDKPRKNRKKVKRRKKTGSRKANNRSMEDSESSDEDFMVSDEDLVEEDSTDPDLVASDDDDFIASDPVAVGKKRKRGKIGKKKESSRTTTTKKRRLVVSDSSDSDYMIPEDEVRDLAICGVMNQQQQKSIFGGRKGEQKAKVKEADVVEKQVCGICLSEEQKMAIQGLLNCCNHYFCFACIMEWSKVESRCPVCKRRFTTITKCMKSDPGFEVKRAVIRVQKRDQVYQPSEEEIRGLIDPYENVVCMVCQEGGHDNFMLLCDICDSPAHTFCAGLGWEVPEGNWYCEGCRSTGDAPSNSQGQAILIDQVTSNTDSFSVSIEAEDLRVNMHADTHSGEPTPIRSRFDLNVPPRHLTEDDTGVMPRTSSAGTTHQHVRVPGTEGLGVNICATANSSGQSSQRFDLNFPPGHLLREDHGVSSQASGSGASTLSGRRAIHQRIRFLLSDTRATRRLSGTGDSGASTLSGRRAIHQRIRFLLSDTRATHRLSRKSEVGQGMASCHSSIGSGAVRHLHSNPNLERMYVKDSSFRHVEGAKEQVWSILRSELKKLSRDDQLEHGTFKDIDRRCTHTILAACGIEHRRSMVDHTAVHPPDVCSHGLGDEGHTGLLKDYCSPCFRSFVTSVVRKLINTTRGR